jgi:hypothetical protein
MNDINAIAKVDGEPRTLYVFPLKQALEQLDRSIKSDDPTEIVIAAGQIAKTVERGWRTGEITLAGTLPKSDELIPIVPPNSIRPALDRFGGPNCDTPEIRMSRNAVHEVWKNIHIDRAGFEWLKSACRANAKGLPKMAARAIDVTDDVGRDGETECRDWLIELMEIGPPARNRDYYEQTAYRRFGVTVRAFRRAWKSAVEQTGNDAWRKTGPKRQAQHHSQPAIKDG